MKWTVRTKEGELVYGSFGEVEQAFRSGLVEPDDELREEGTDKWRKASALPLLAKAQPGKSAYLAGAQLWLVVLAIALFSFALYSLARGRYAYGLGAALLISLVVTRVVWK